MDLRDLREIDNLCCLALLFAGGGIVGWIYEMLFYRINDGMFVQRGQGLGPWLPIYGFGSVFICLLAVRFEKSKIAVFLVSALVSGVLEYATGWVLYNLLGGLRIPAIEWMADRIPVKAFRVISFVPAVLFLIDIVGGYILHVW